MTVDTAIKAAQYGAVSKGFDHLVVFCGDNYHVWDRRRWMRETGHVELVAEALADGEVINHREGPQRP